MEQEMKERIKKVNDLNKEINELNKKVAAEGPPEPMDNILRTQPVKEILLFLAEISLIVRIGSLFELMEV